MTHYRIAVSLCWMIASLACSEETAREALNTDGSDPSSNDGTAAEGDGETDPPVASDGCGATVLESGPHTIDVDGTERSFILDLPTAYDENTPYPVVFGFHGMGTDGEMFRSAYYGNLLSAMADGAIVVHPNAIGDPTAWDEAVDVPFFDAMVEYLAASVCVDENRIFATGHSSGGFFSNTLGCARGDVLRAIAPVSGGGPFVFGGTTCTGQVAAWLAHADNDETVDFSSGEGSRDHWAEANGCDTGDAQAVTPDGCVSYGGCDAGYPVHWCVYHEGHDWADFAPEGMWNFFNGL